MMSFNMKQFVDKIKEKIAIVEKPRVEKHLKTQNNTTKRCK